MDVIVLPAVTRVLGALTTAYGAAVIVAPKVLAEPCGLTTATDRVTPGTRALIGAIGARDAAIGVAMMLAPPGRALRTALAMRVAADAGDALVLGTTLPDRHARAKVAAVAIAWAALCAASTAMP